MKKIIAAVLLLLLAIGLTQCVMADPSTPSTAVWESMAPTVTAPATTAPKTSETEATEATAPTAVATESGSTFSPEAPTGDTAAADHRETEPSVPQSEATEPTEDLVWISRTGSKYHTNPNCSNMKGPTQLTREEAEAQGYAPCKRCC